MDIQAKVAQVTQKFDEVKAQIDQLNEELLRLQGEYRALKALEAEKPEVKVKKETK